ncbi:MULTISPECIES: hypothetical protein [Vibrio]|uniref:Alpha/beta hydrolase n=3 Tax=Vibrio TaxID=662 RepID=A0A2N7NIM7_9VIBR|nr:MULTISPECIES: hypothetical protein [Vibrio]PMP14782.1 hypothetical protein BCS92_12220 [Vibrio tasmaniensis]TKG36066.1 hypothetical protein FC057_04400 [Vibrio tasmaniensis]TKG42613.1 hypothetical protein FC063_03365 [Vibrio tasmaniensis]TKG49181.1 hypothetical protein FC060_08240 [Vibrio tasmaniensis]TKG54576.1 hypothetical protein FC070_03910 [Vibrio tasmaniensis]
MNKIKIFNIFLSLSVVLLFGCSFSKWEQINLDSENFESYGNESSEVVIINAQGGAFPDLERNFLREMFSWLDLGRYMLLNVHQTQTKPGSDFESREITFEDAKEADKQSVLWLSETINKFKDSGKRVYVVGASFGAFMVQESLATQGNVADGYLLMVGRLDMPSEVWTEFAGGRMVGFEDNNTIVDFSAQEAGMGGDGLYTDINMAKLSAGLAYNRYSETLKGLDMRNVTYVYAASDEQVGALTEAETSFLREHGAKVIIKDTDHVETALSIKPILQAMIEE